VAVRMASAAATAAATGPPVGSMVGASAVAAAAVGLMAAGGGWSTVRDDFAVAVATLWGSAGVGAGAVGLSKNLSSSTVGTVVGAATCGFVVAVPGGRRLVDPVVCRMDLPGPTTSVGIRTDYSVGPWDYLACATRHLKAWSTRTT
jgi:hypothetical protein